MSTWPFENFRTWSGPEKLLRWRRGTCDCASRRGALARLPGMKVAHVRERHGPAGAPWRLAAALDGGDAPTQWLDLEVARRRAAAADPRLAHNATLYRQPLTTLDDHLARGSRVEALRDLVEGFERRDEDDDAVIDAADLALRAAGPAAAVVA